MADLADFKDFMSYKRNIGMQFETCSCCGEYKLVAAGAGNEQYLCQTCIDAIAAAYVAKYPREA